MLLLCCAQVCCSTRCGDVATPGKHSQRLPVAKSKLFTVGVRPNSTTESGEIQMLDGMGFCHRPGRTKTVAAMPLATILLVVWWLKGAWLTETG